MALQFNHISKNALEELFEKDLTRSGKEVNLKD